jgi:hypothetical protein
MGVEFQKPQNPSRFQERTNKKKCDDFLGSYLILSRN